MKQQDSVEWQKMQEDILGKSCGKKLIEPSPRDFALVAGEAYLISCHPEESEGSP